MAVKIGLVVPIYKNLQGALELFQSVDTEVQPIIISNWVRNIGVSAGWNAGLKRATAYNCDLALVCNDDILLAPGTIRGLAAAVWNRGCDLATPINTRDDELSNIVSETADFACFMVKPEEFLEKFGEFDENFTPAYFEDNDMAYRIKRAGGEFAKFHNLGFHHYGSVTQNWGGEQVVTGSMFERNRAYYVNKWGGVPGYEAYTTPYNDPNRKISDW